jgi:putative transposase
MEIGHDRFREEIEKLTGRRLKPQKAGRPVGWRKKKDGIYVSDPV